MVSILLTAEHDSEAMSVDSYQSAPVGKSDLGSHGLPLPTDISQQY